MLILSIDTSCDDTCCAILKLKTQNSKRKATTQNLKLEDIKFEILSNVVSSQVKLHRKYGGVYPTLAKREHQRNLPRAVKQALQEADVQYQVLNIIAVTVGPGLEPCLWQGVNFAKELAHRWNLPLIPVNHIEAHISANWLAPVGGNSKSQTLNSKQIPNSKSQNSKQIKFPVICLVVSGGHTQLILMRKIGDYKILGETRDDAAGECFDKTARILGLGYPGGPAIAAAAARFQVSGFRFQDIKLPRPMIYSKDYDFSFSGLKTAVLYDFKKRSSEVRNSKEYTRAMAAEIQQAIIDVLIVKTLRAAKEYQAKTIMLGGGVAANQELRQQFQKACLMSGFERLGLIMPEKELCTDNAAMAAVAGYFNWLQGKSVLVDKIKAEANLRLG